MLGIFKRVGFLLRGDKVEFNNGEWDLGVLGEIWKGGCPQIFHLECPFLPLVEKGDFSGEGNKRNLVVGERGSTFEGG